jgi:formylglycine-generating enzyme required for sulfatase activity
LIDGAKLEEREALAALVGFERRESKHVYSVTINDGISFKEQIFEPPPETKAEARPTAKAPLFWRVIAQQTLPESEITDQTIPLWARNWNPNRKPADRVPPSKLPEEVSLLHWPRLLGFLRMHLVYEHPSQSPDERRLVRRLAEARPLNRIPRKTYRRWPHQIVLVLDRSDAVYPLWNDFDRLTKQLQHMLGTHIKVIEMGARSQPLASQFEEKLSEASLSPEDALSARWLILSDLGAAESQTGRTAFWQAFLRWLKSYTSHRRPLALVNAPPAQWWAGLGQLTEAAFWDLDRPLRLSRGDPITEIGPSVDHSRLLAMLSMADEARPRLVRKLRRLLPLHQQDVSWEIAAWNHPDVRHFAVSCFIDPDKKPDYQVLFQRFRKAAGSAEDWPAQVEQVIENDHKGMRSHVQDNERALSCAVNNIPDNDADYLVEAIFRLRDMRDGPDRELLLNWIYKVAASTHPGLTKHNDKLGAIRYMAYRERRLRGQPTPDLDPRFDFIFAQQPERECLLWQQGEGWGVKFEDDQGSVLSGSPIGALRSRNTVFEIWPDDGSNDALGFWASGAPPPWASDWGEDEYGPWAEFRIEDKAGKPVSQRLRWIEPGSFQMGSPAGERERDRDESKHAVTLTEGYWLGDTTCTQALWQAVMGESPSAFKGAERPVEQVSWEDTMTFMTRLNGQITGLDLRLPTEAEWEYACRAGTQTPFWFGANITTEQVNYDGNFPYAGGTKGKDRGETVEVKALPCNGWGLYQMHGNVWEWCNDWYGVYTEGSVTNPQGTASGEGRVRRGGGWVYYGRDARSAQRGSSTPVYRLSSIGFRLARGQVGAEPAGPQAARLAERRAEAGRPSAAPLPQLGYGVAVPPLALPQQRLIVASDREELTLEALTQPDWAEAIGRDRFGLFTEFSVQGVSQRLRWINPGRFFMGSAEDEAERLDNETRHEVILSEGFWLADTACTQALWQVVMDKNPSEFKGAERPVEQVSWEDTMTFMTRLNGQITGLDLRLPTEAEWEYACRAGTQTPFWFGANITTEQVNYDGNFPYAGGTKGKDRGETVEVKALPCNGWGLYQMHGNVWEWCNDWYGVYTEGSVTNPQGTASSEGRVRRGGGWVSGGRDARSARRDSGAPVDRYSGVGFRLARGQSGSWDSSQQAARGRVRRRGATTDKPREMSGPG